MSHKSLFITLLLISLAYAAKKGGVQLPTKFNALEALGRIK